MDKRGLVILNSSARTLNKLSLRNATNTAEAGSCTPGLAGALTNTQGTPNCASTTVAGSRNNLTVNWNITQKTAFVGTKNLYMYAYDSSNVTVGFTDKGDWKITPKL